MSTPSKLWLWTKRALAAFALLCLLLGILAGTLWWYFNPPFTATPGLVYTQRKGKDLTIDVFTPPNPNGAGVLLMVSGSWKSGKNSARPFMIAPILRRGYTVFAISHGSQPEFSVMEIVEDIHRAVRYVRAHANEHRIDPNRLAITGGSSGGHLTLMIATRGTPGNPEATDPIERLPSTVRAAACFYPVTDLLNLGTSTENPGNGGPPKSFVRAFGPDATNLTVWKPIGHQLSPLHHVHSNLPPTLIIHGDADTLVPLDQSQRYQTAARSLGNQVELIVRPGKKHGWLTMLWDIRLFADWFDRWMPPATATP